MKNKFALFIYLFAIMILAGSCKKENSQNCTGVNISVAATMEYDGTITVTVTGGIAPYGFSLDGSAFGSSNIFPGNHSNGSHSITVKDVNGCQGSAMLNLTGNICLDTRDGQYYPARQIGSLVWLTKNLNYVMATGTYCYDDNPANCDTFGRLYNWDAAQIACPSGWRLPTLVEITAMRDAFGGHAGACSRLLKNGDSGFESLLGGQRMSTGVYDAIRLWGMYYTSTEDSPGYSDLMIIQATAGLVLTVSGMNNESAFSVRCVKN